MRQHQPRQGNHRPTRPTMPPSYGILKPSDGSGLLSWDWVTARMARARNYWIGTTQPDGTPHIMPVWGIWLNGAFYFATDRQSRKGRNLSLNSQVVVHLESGEEVVILEGLAEEVTELSALRQFANAYIAKYQVQVEVTTASLRTSVIFVVRTRKAFAWLESDYIGSTTRWRFNG